jgi:hypothetical protein
MKLLSALGVVGLLGLVGCPGPGKSYIPVDSPLRQWQKPEIASEITPAADTSKKPDKKSVK